MTVEPSLRVVTRPARRSTASCWDRFVGSIPTSGTISATEWSRWLSNSSTRIRAGWPNVLKNSAFNWYRGLLIRGSSLSSTDLRIRPGPTRRLMALPVSGKSVSVSSDTVSHDSTVANLIKLGARCECAMGEPVVATVMTCPAVAVTPNTQFKDVVNALLAGDAYAVPVVDTEARPLGTVTEADLLANLEFHGGTDAVPIFGGAAARRRWRKASALTGAELMAAPGAVVGADAPDSK